MEKKYRFYWKCSWCLSAFVLEGDSPRAASPAVCQCGHEGGLKLMGEVKGNLYKAYEEKAPCDDRCTNAAGPNCDCRCNGENHGNQKVVRFLVEQGKIRIVNNPDAAAVAKEYFDAREAALARYFSKYGQAALDMKAGKFIQDKSLWWEMKCSQERLHKISGMKIRGKRLEAFKAYCAVEVKP
jgi:hypothetical protein